MPEPQDLYEILQVHHAAEPEVIEAAYRRLARKYHPDVNNSPESAEVMKRLNLAYEVLRDPVKRAAYDRQRAQQAQEAKKRPTRRKTITREELLDTLRITLLEALEFNRKQAISIAEGGYQEIAIQI